MEAAGFRAEASPSNSTTGVTPGVKRASTSNSTICVTPNKRTPSGESGAGGGQRRSGQRTKSLTKSLSHASGGGFGGLHKSEEQERLRHEEEAEKGIMWKIASNPAFELVVAFAIVFNGAVMAAESQYNGFDVAEEVGSPYAQGPAAEVWPLAETVFKVSFWLFGIFFLIEIIFKFVALRAEFMYDAWNWIDLATALIWVFATVFGSGVNATFMRIGRLARMFRLVRLLKFMRGNFSDSLFVILTALKDCYITTAWSLALLLVIHSMLALFMSEFLTEFYFSTAEFLENDADVDKGNMYQYFGSFSRSFLTMFEFTFANWITPTRILVENVSEGYSLYAVMHKVVIGFATVGVIGAVFIQETFKVAQMDDSLMVRQLVQREKTHAHKMRRLFSEIDKDGSGEIDKDEWMSVCKDEWVHTWIRAQEIRAQDASSLFEMLDNGDGRLTADELITGTAKLKGPSAMMAILEEVRNNKTVMDEIKRELLFAQQAVASERM